MVRIGNLFPTAALMAAMVFSNSSYSDSNQASNSAVETASKSQAHPNLQGIWDFRTLTPLQRPLELGDKTVFSAEEAEAFRQKSVDSNDAIVPLRRMLRPNSMLSFLTTVSGWISVQ